MRIKATIVAYAFSVQYFENATVVAYAGLRVNSDKNLRLKANRKVTICWVSILIFYTRDSI